MAAPVPTLSYHGFLRDVCIHTILPPHDFCTHTILPPMAAVPQCPATASSMTCVSTLQYPKPSLPLSSLISLVWVSTVLLFTQSKLCQRSFLPFDDSRGLLGSSKIEMMGQLRSSPSLSVPQPQASCLSLIALPLNPSQCHRHRASCLSLIAFTLNATGTEPVVCLLSPSLSMLQAQSQLFVSHRPPSQSLSVPQAQG